MTKKIKLSTQNQITIPKSILTELQIPKRSYLSVSIVDGKITLEPKKNPIKKYVGVLKGKVNLTTAEYLKIRKKESNKEI